MKYFAKLKNGKTHTGYGQVALLPMVLVNENLEVYKLWTELALMLCLLYLNSKYRISSFIDTYDIKLSC